MTYNVKMEEYININITLGKKIRVYREEQGYNQDEFAEECQLSRAYYGRIERGEHSITIDTCQKISKTLGISLSQLFENL